VYQRPRCTIPGPQYYVPAKPLPRQHFYDECDQSCEPVEPSPQDSESLIMPGQPVPTTSDDQWMDMEIISDQN
jgi:hypothetical protein